MKTRKKACIVHALALAPVCGAFAACGDDVTYGYDAGPPKSDATIDQSTVDAGDASSARLLMTYSAASGELVALNTSTKQIGRLTTPPYAIVARSGKDTFLIEGNEDLVARLDPSTFSAVASSWSVASNDGVDGGASYADPVQVVEVAANKAYVLRYNRNRIAIIDPSQSADAGAATSSIDLSSLVQSNDSDGVVDMTGAFFDSTRNRLYVVLGNVDLTTVGPPTFDLFCVATTMTMIAIDTTNDSLVNLGGAGPGGGVVLNGYNPQSAAYNGVVHDAAGDRALVVSLGCNPSQTDGGAGPIQQRIVEAFDLKTNTTQTLLDANAQDVPNVFSYIDSTHAVIQFGVFAPTITTYAWNPTQTTLGQTLPSPDVFDYDDAGHILGPQSTFASDGAAGPVNVISVTLADGGVVQLAQNPFLQTGGFAGSALYSP